MADAAPQTYTVDVMARVLDLTPRRVQQLAKERVLPTVGRGKYALVPCVHAYIKYWRDRAEGRAAETDVLRFDQARARKMSAEAELAEIELAKARGQVVPLEDYEAAIGTILDRLTARLRAMPVRLSHFGVDTESAAEAEVERIVVELHGWDEDVVEDTVADDRPAPAA